MQAKVRIAMPSDAEGIAKVHVGSWRETYKGLISDEYLASLSVEKRMVMWTQSLNQISEGDVSKQIWIALNTDNKVIGFVSGGIAREEVSGIDGELYAVYLDKAAHRTGVGKKLVYELATWLSQNKFKCMYLWVLDNNPTRGFYEAIGGELLPNQKHAEIGGQKVFEFAYGWRDLPTLIHKCGSREYNSSPPVL